MHMALCRLNRIAKSGTTRQLLRKFTNISEASRVPRHRFHTASLATECMANYDFAPDLLATTGFASASAGFVFLAGGLITGDVKAIVGGASAIVGGGLFFKNADDVSNIIKDKHKTRQFSHINDTLKTLGFNLEERNAFRLIFESHDLLDQVEYEFKYGSSNQHIIQLNEYLKSFLNYGPIKFDIVTKTEQRSKLFLKGMQVFCPDIEIGIASYQKCMDILYNKFAEKNESYKLLQWNSSDINKNMEELGYNLKERNAFKAILDVHRIEYKEDVKRGYSGLERVLKDLHYGFFSMTMLNVTDAEKQLFVESMQTFYPDFALNEKSYDQCMGILVDMMTERNNQHSYQSIAPVRALR